MYQFTIYVYIINKYEKVKIININKLKEIDGIYMYICIYIKLTKNKKLNRYRSINMKK